MILDNDGDGVMDDLDSNPNDPFECSDVDGDTCDDCSSGSYDPFNDGYDVDGDGQCEDGLCLLYVNLAQNELEDIFFISLTNKILFGLLCIQLCILIILFWPYKLRENSLNTFADITLDSFESLKISDLNLDFI